MQWEQSSLFDDNPEYDAFVEKFKPKKTTDDCYTPPLVYDAVREWACREYGIDKSSIVRPFYPGGDYERFEYPKGCCVLDNPPFSILSRICEFYLDREIDFFLFAPSLTAFSGRSVCLRMNHIICDADITYENGAVVRTAFVTSFGGAIAQTAPGLGEAVRLAMKKIKTEKKREIPKYTYPSYVLTAAMLQRYSHYGIGFRVEREDCTFISKLDSQRDMGKAIFGGRVAAVREGCSREGCSREGRSREGRSREGRSREGRSREGRSAYLGTVRARKGNYRTTR